MDVRLRRLEALVARAGSAALERDDAAVARYARLAAEALAGVRSGRYGPRARVDLLACGEWFALRAVDAGGVAPHLKPPDTPAPTHPPAAGPSAAAPPAGPGHADAAGTRLPLAR